jgi:hypothetical protein
MMVIPFRIMFGLERVGGVSESIVYALLHGSWPPTTFCSWLLRVVFSKHSFLSGALIFVVSAGDLLQLCGDEPLCAYV